MDTELAGLLFNQMIDKYHKALGEFNRGNAQPVLDIFSSEEDVSLSNPVGPTVMGRSNVMRTAERVASAMHEGQATGFENLTRFVSCDFAYIVENEHYRTKVSSKQEFEDIDLRVTSIFRMEHGGWKMVHRHADPIVTDQTVEATTQK
jgi:ketosteroid isomerase-like protein